MTREEIKYLEKISSKVGQAINKFNLIEENDKIAVGLSGGKDSFVMLETLAKRRKHLPIQYTIEPIHIKIKSVNYQIDTAFYEDLCASMNLPFHLIEIDADLTYNPKKQVCFVCSWHRRKALFTKSRELKCNKLALGHHRDDAIETLMMNMIYHGSISSIPEKLTIFDGDMEIIRPLILLSNEELEKYAVYRQMPLMHKNCIHEKSSKRHGIKDIIELASKMNPQAKVNLFRSMSKICTEYLPHK